MIELNSGFTTDGYNGSEFRWRPAHHDLSSNSLGYSDQLQIQILDFVLAYNEEYEQTYVKRWVPLELTSLGKHELAQSPRSWRVEIAYNKDRNRHDEEQLYDRSQLKVGFGGARFFGRFGAYMMAQFAGGYSNDHALFWHVGGGPRAGVYYTFSDSFKFSTMFEYMRHYGANDELDRRELNSRLSYFWRIENEAYSAACTSSSLPRSSSWPDSGWINTGRFTKCTLAQPIQQLCLHLFLQHAMHGLPQHARVAVASPRRILALRQSSPRDRRPRPRLPALPQRTDAVSGKRASHQSPVADRQLRFVPRRAGVISRMPRSTAFRMEPIGSDE